MIQTKDGKENRMGELAYVNGQFLPISEAKVSIEDRGYQFGDGVYEGIAVYGGRPFLLDRHLVRLRQSCDAVGLRYDFVNHPLGPVILEGLQRSGLRDAFIYVQVTRGVAPRMHVVPKNIAPSLVITFKPMPRISQELRGRGAKVITTLDTRWAKCFIKAITLLPNVLARTEAIERGFDDAVFVSETGQVREAPAANVFVVINGVLRMPTRSDSVLHGITQAFLMQCAAECDIPVEEGPMHINTLKSAEEVFLSSTVVEVLGVIQVDDQTIGDGTVGPVTRRLADCYRSKTHNERVSEARSAEHPNENYSIHTSFQRA